MSKRWTKPVAETILVLTIFVLFLIGCLLSPFNFAFDEPPNTAFLFEVSWSDILLNIFLFAPIGLGVASLFTHPSNSILLTLMIAGATGFVISSTLELGQLYLPRSASLIDVAANSIGALFGVFLHSLHRRYQNFAITSCAVLMRKSWFWFSAVTFTAVVAIIRFVPLPLEADFSNWNSGYSLQIANETDGTRPWHGRLYEVSLYDNAKTSEEVIDDYLAGHNRTAGDIRGPNLIARYSFMEGDGFEIRNAVRTVGGRFSFDDSKNVRWLDTKGIEISGNVGITQAATSEIFERLTEKPLTSMTLTVWLEMSDLQQFGPARIVSYSNGVSHRNFTLSVEQKDVQFRLRTPVSGLNGNSPETSSIDGPIGLGPQHVTTVINKGQITIYVNGIKTAENNLNERSWTAYDEFEDKYFFQNYRHAVWIILFSAVGLTCFLLSAKLNGAEEKGLVLNIAKVAAVAVILMIFAQRVLLNRSLDAEFFLTTCVPFLLANIAGILVLRIIEKNVSAEMSE